MRISELSVEAALASLGSARHGLAQAEAGRRRAEYGPNRLERIEREPLALRYVRQLTHFFALILWDAAGLAYLAEYYDPGTGMALLGTAIDGSGQRHGRPQPRACDSHSAAGGSASAGRRRPVLHSR